MEINKDLIAASSTPIVLAILAEEDSYGYAILQRVRELSGGRMEWTDGMLYPVLHRLERVGHVEARGGGGGGGRRVGSGLGGAWRGRTGFSTPFCIGSSGSATSRRGGKLRGAGVVASTTGSRPGAGIGSPRDAGGGERRGAGVVASPAGSRPGAGIGSRRNAGSGKRWTLRCGASGRRSPHPLRPSTRRRTRHRPRGPDAARPRRRGGGRGA